MRRTIPSVWLLAMAALLPPNWALAAESAAESATECAALRVSRLPYAEVIDAAETPPGAAPVPVASAGSFCRVRVLARPTPASAIRIEVWLPLRTHWNGRFASIGNPGLAGSLPHRAMALRLEAGYAVAGTDTGHQAAADDAAWALGQPEKLVDYGHRAVSVTAALAQQLTAAYYGQAPAGRYFVGYSNGGREALVLAQRDPDAYDGILAGAPALEPVRSYLLWTQLFQRLERRPDARLSSWQLSRLRDAVLEACDLRDGVRDGVLAEPQRCNFDPATLACPAAAGTAAAGAPGVAACLNTAQLAFVRTLYEGLPSRPGEEPFGALALGSEPTWGALFGDGEQPSQLQSSVVSVFRHMIVEDPARDLASFQPEHEAGTALRRLGPVIDARSPDLRAYFQRGGKLILWHGWNDAVLSPLQTLAYYRALVERVGPELAARSVRLFMAPGVEHGTTGPGPARFGQLSPGNGNPQRSLSAALRRWVETGEPPEQVIAARHQVQRDPNSLVVGTALICAWPRVAGYRGSGSTDDAASFRCEP
jgi:hypothetical protein